MTLRFDELPEDSMTGHARSAEIRSGTPTSPPILADETPGSSPEVLLLAAIKLLNRAIPQAMTPFDRSLLKAAKVFFEELARLCDQVDSVAKPKPAAAPKRAINSLPESVGPDSSTTSGPTRRTKR